MSGSDVADVADVAAVIAASRPRHPAAHAFEVGGTRHLFLSDRSQVFDLEPELYASFERALSGGDAEAVDRLLRAAGADLPPAIDPVGTLDPPPVRALSLNLAQACNLACSYCYAEGGDFGGPATNMSAEVADQAVAELIAQARPGERVSLAFLGGEPLLNRKLLRHVVTSARELADERQVRVSFSVTTNGTLLDEDAAELFAANRFAVTVSMDGIRASHDLLRPTRRGFGSFDTIVAGLAPLLERRDEISLSARVTVTRHNLNLLETLEGLAEVGFPSVGFSPMLAAPSGRDGLGPADIELLLARMIECGLAFEAAVSNGERHPFANLSTALTEIHRGLHRPYSCGAGAGYLSVSASGDLFACHRFVGDERAAMGSLDAGPDDGSRAVWLTEKHVDRQSPCSGCWARYLCGGGCHHEVLNRGRPMCDYIRGWLHYCLGAYVRLESRFPVASEASVCEV